MSTEPDQWIQAEENFHLWIEDSANYPDDEHSKLRKSVHIYFRQKYGNLLTSIVKWVFDELPLQELLDKEKQKEKDFYTPAIIQEKEVDVTESLESIPAYKRRRAPSLLTEQILDGFLNNDRNTIYDFYEEEFSKVAWMILNNSGSIEDAKDIFQDAMVILMDKFTWGKLDLDCSLGTYVYSISKNLWMETLRRRKKENEFIDIEYYDTIEISIDYYKEEPDIFPLVVKTIETLGNPCKQLLELYYFENHSWETVAFHMGYSSAASARNQKYKCLERIREMIKNQ